MRFNDPGGTETKAPVRMGTTVITNRPLGSPDNPIDLDAPVRQGTTVIANRPLGSPDNPIDLDAPLGSESNPIDLDAPLGSESNPIDLDEPVREGTTVITNRELGTPDNPIDLDAPLGSESNPIDLDAPLGSESNPIDLDEPVRTGYTVITSRELGTPDNPIDLDAPVDVASSFDPSGRSIQEPGFFLDVGGSVSATAGDVGLRGDAVVRKYENSPEETLHLSTAGQTTLGFDAGVSGGFFYGYDWGGEAMEPNRLHLLILEVSWQFEKVDGTTRLRGVGFSGGVGSGAGISRDWGTIGTDPIPLPRF